MFSAFATPRDFILKAESEEVTYCVPFSLTAAFLSRVTEQLDCC